MTFQSRSSVLCVIVLMTTPISHAEDLIPAWIWTKGCVKVNESDATIMENVMNNSPETCFNRCGPATDAIVVKSYSCGCFHGNITNTIRTKGYFYSLTTNTTPCTGDRTVSCGCVGIRHEHKQGWSLYTRDKVLNTNSSCVSDLSNNETGCVIAGFKSSNEISCVVKSCDSQSIKICKDLFVSDCEFIQDSRWSSMICQDQPFIVIESVDDLLFGTCWEMISERASRGWNSQYWFGLMQIQVTVSAPSSVLSSSETLFTIRPTVSISSFTSSLSESTVDSTTIEFPLFPSTVLSVSSTYPGSTSEIRSSLPPSSVPLTTVLSSTFPAFSSEHLSTNHMQSTEIPVMASFSSSVPLISSSVETLKTKTPTKIMPTASSPSISLPQGTTVGAPIATESSKHSNRSAFTTNDATLGNINTTPKTTIKTGVTTTIAPKTKPKNTAVENFNAKNTSEKEWQIPTFISLALFVIIILVIVIIIMYRYNSGTRKDMLRMMQIHTESIYGGSRFSMANIPRNTDLGDELTVDNLRMFSRGAPGGAQYSNGSESEIDGYATLPRFSHAARFSGLPDSQSFMHPGRSSTGREMDERSGYTRRYIPRKRQYSDFYDTRSLGSVGRRFGNGTYGSGTVRSYDPYLYRSQSDIDTFQRRHAHHDRSHAYIYNSNEAMDNFNEQDLSEYPSLGRPMSKLYVSTENASVQTQMEDIANTETREQSDHHNTCKPRSTGNSVVSQGTSFITTLPNLPDVGISTPSGSSNDHQGDTRSPDTMKDVNEREDMLY